MSSSRPRDRGNIKPAPSPDCFKPTIDRWQDGSVSFEAYLGELLRHFEGARHWEDEDVSPESIRFVGAWDAIAGAVKVCISDPDFRPPPVAAILPVLLRCRDATLDEAESLDQAARRDHGVSVLRTPLLNQLVVATALRLNNRPLARDIVVAVPMAAPPLAHHILGGTISRPLYFGTYYSVGHPVHVGQADNACDFWAAAVGAHWCRPSVPMLSWAATATDTAAGVALVDALAAFPDLVAGDPTVTFYNHYGDLDTCLSECMRTANPGCEVLLDRLLERVPGLIAAARENAGWLLARSVSRPAAGARLAAVLLGRGVATPSLLDEAAMPAHDPPDPRDPRDHAERIRWGLTTRQTALHVAAEAGNVDAVRFLIRDAGADPAVRDGWGRTAYDRALLGEKDGGPQAQLTREVMRMLEDMGYGPSTGEDEGDGRS